MQGGSVAFPECCRYCPHRTEVTSSCDHAARQSLISHFATPADVDRPCPVFEDVRAEKMAELSRRLDDAFGSLGER